MISFLAWDLLHAGVSYARPDWHDLLTGSRPAGTCCVEGRHKQQAAQDLHA